MINIKAIRVIDLIPPNLQHDEKVQAAATAIDQELKQVTEFISKLPLWGQLDKFSEQWVDKLAWQFHVDFYEPNLPIEHKIELVRNSLKWHRRKGTPSAVEELVNTVFYGGQVEEWWEYGGEPGYFKVVVADPSATHERAEEFLAAVNSVKNARSWLEKIEIKDKIVMEHYFGYALHMGEYMTVKQVV